VCGYYHHEESRYGLERGETALQQGEETRLLILTLLTDTYLTYWNAESNFIVNLRGADIVILIFRVKGDRLQHCPCIFTVPYLVYKYIWLVSDPVIQITTVFSTKI